VYLVHCKQVYWLKRNAGHVRALLIN